MPWASVELRAIGLKANQTLTVQIRGGKVWCKGLGPGWYSKGRKGKMVPGFENHRSRK